MLTNFCCVCLLCCAVLPCSVVRARRLTTLPVSARRLTWLTKTNGDPPTPLSLQGTPPFPVKSRCGLFGSTVLVTSTVLLMMVAFNIGSTGSTWHSGCNNSRCMGERKPKVGPIRLYEHGQLLPSCADAQTVSGWSQCEEED